MVDCVCKICDKHFTVTPTRIADGGGKYCSNACKRLGRQNRVICTCEICATTFWVSKSRFETGSAKYCSYECKAIGQLQLVSCECEFCHELFTVTRANFSKGYGRFCNRRCSAKSRSNRVEIACPCGKIFVVQRKAIDNGHGKYCSITCSNKYKKAWSGISSPHWRGGTSTKRGANWPQQRNLARERDGSICQTCHRRQQKGEKRFAVHHIKPYRQFNGDYIAANDLSNLITLCPKCHSKAEHGKIPVPKRLF